MKPEQIESAWLIFPLLVTGALIAIGVMIVFAAIRGALLRRRVAKQLKDARKRSGMFPILLAIGTMSW